MNSKLVPALLTAGVLAIATSTVANSAETPEFSISCQILVGVPTTV